MADIRMLVGGIVPWRGLGAGPRQEERSKARELSLLRLAEGVRGRSSAASACGAPTETAAVQPAWSFSKAWPLPERFFMPG